MPKRLALCAALIAGIACMFGLPACGNSETQTPRNKPPATQDRKEGS